MWGEADTCLTAGAVLPCCCLCGVAMYECIVVVYVSEVFFRCAETHNAAMCKKTYTSPFHNSSGDVENMIDFIKEDFSRVWRNMHFRSVNQCASLKSL